MSSFLQTELVWNISRFHFTPRFLRKLKTTKTPASGPIFQSGCPEPRFLVSTPPVSVCNLFFKIVPLSCHCHPPTTGKPTDIQKRAGQNIGKRDKAKSREPRCSLLPAQRPRLARASPSMGTGAGEQFAGDPEPAAGLQFPGEESGRGVFLEQKSVHATLALWPLQKLPIAHAVKPTPLPWQTRP